MILWSGALIAILYSFAIGGILFAVPIGKLSIVTGTWDALAVLGKQWGRAGDTVVFCLGIGFLYACIANVVTWSLGSNRVAAVAAEEGMLPAVLGRLHPRFKTPYLAFVAMGVVSTGTPRRGRAPLEQPVEHLLDDVPPDGALPAPLLPPGLPGLSRPAQAAARTSRARTACPAAPWRRPSAAWVCTLYIFGACVLFFVPSPTSQEPLKEGLILGGETLVTIVIGYLLIPRRSGA